MEILVSEELPATKDRFKNFEKGVSEACPSAFWMYEKIQLPANWFSYLTPNKTYLVLVVKPHRGDMRPLAALLQYAKDTPAFRRYP